MNIFQKWRARRTHKAQLQRLHTFASTFASMQRLEKGGLLTWEEKTRRLFIAQPLALVMLAQGYDRWRNFLNNVFLYHMYNLQNKQWQDYVLDEQAKAVRQRKSEVTILTKAETERIRRTVRDNIPADAVPLLPIKPFEFFIIAETAAPAAAASSSPADTVSAGSASGEIPAIPRAEITWVGEYDPDTATLDMAEWSTIKHLLNEKEKR